MKSKRLKERDIKTLYVRRVKGKLPPLTEEEYREWRRRIGPLGLATISAIRMPSNKYTSLQQGSSN